MKNGSQNILICFIRHFRFLCLLPLFLSACVTMRECPIETLQPAKLVFTGQNRNIAICASPVLFSDALLTNERTAGVPADSLIWNILYSLKSSWETAPGFEDVKISVFMASGNEPLPDSTEYDLIADLDKLQLKNTYYGEQYNYQAWEAFMHVYYIAEWSVRDKSGRLLDDHTDRDLIVWPSGVRSTQAEAVFHLPGITDAWWDTGIAIARNYAERITPQWQTDYRDVYMINKFSDLSQQAYTAMQNNGYGRAFNIWEEMLLSCRKKGQSKIKSQITYNMAVACEFNNSLNDALYWIQRSVNYSSSTTNNNYLRILKERMTQSILLDQQLPQ